MHVKRAIIFSKINGTPPTPQQVKTLTKNTCNHERYIATIRGKLEMFETRWELLLNIQEYPCYFIYFSYHTYKTL